MLMVSVLAPRAIVPPEPSMAPALTFLLPPGPLPEKETAPLSTINVALPPVLLPVNVVVPPALVVMVALPPALLPENVVVPELLMVAAPAVLLPENAMVLPLLLVMTASSARPSLERSRPCPCRRR